MICGLIFPGDSLVSFADVKDALVVTSATAAAAAAAEAAAAADFLEDNTVADIKVCWVGEIILDDVSVKVELAPSCGSPGVTFARRLGVEDANDDGVVVVVFALVAEMVGTLSIVVADVTAAVAAAVTVAVVDVVVVVGEPNDDKCNVAFLVYGIVAPLAIGRDAVVAVITEEAFLLPLAVIGVVFFPLTESSGRPFDDAGTADAVISSTNQTQHWIARIFNTDAVMRKDAASAKCVFAATCSTVSFLERY